MRWHPSAVETNTVRPARAAAATTTTTTATTTRRRTSDSMPAGRLRSLLSLGVWPRRCDTRMHVPCGTVRVVVVACKRNDPTTVSRLLSLSSCKILMRLVAVVVIIIIIIMMVSNENEQRDCAEREGTGKRFQGYLVLVSVARVAARRPPRPLAWRRPCWSPTRHTHRDWH